MAAGYKTLSDAASQAEEQPTHEVLQAVPRHVAIIMDGNGRWAVQRGLSRTQGHRRGVEAVRRIVRETGALGIKFL